MSKQGNFEGQRRWRTVDNNSGAGLSVKVRRESERREKTIDEERVSKGASESAFSFGGKTVLASRSALKSKTIEALICLQDWHRGDSVEDQEQFDLEFDDEIVREDEEEEDDDYDDDDVNPFF
ncbi:hypothetical protein SOVF_090060 [Spinacia oleracea]|nr:hypothetical protein SOVF_090060 [Spinacia oleracea]